MPPSTYILGCIKIIKVVLAVSKNPCYIFGIDKFPIKVASILVSPPVWGCSCGGEPVVLAGRVIVPTLVGVTSLDALVQKKFRAVLPTPIRLS